MSTRTLIVILLGGLTFGCGDGESTRQATDFGVDVGPVDDDSDGIRDSMDNCPDVANPDQADLDGDALGDACDPDDDGDGVVDEADGCPRIPDPERLDYDEDGIGDECDDDDDNDGVSDDADLCPFDATDEGQDQDNDGLGDPCDFDIDGDEILNADDNCPAIANTAQDDLDADGLGDGCDPDRDGDEVLDGEDNCPSTMNPEQQDLDIDGLGDLCDDETDGDGLVDSVDNCPRVLNPDQVDDDFDGVGNACDLCPADPANDEDEDGVCGDVDNCPTVANQDQNDDDEDGRGTACDTCPLDPQNDDDLDTVCGSIDNCLEAANEDQSDQDRDGLGDACDPCPNDADNDHDQDGVCGDVDICPLTQDADQLNEDGDAFGDACDLCPEDPNNDADGDSICGNRDNCPEFPNPLQADDDGDGIGDACDECVAGGRTDPDGDAICGVVDNCPEVANPGQLDRDQDLVGDECDQCPGDDENDVDGDGVCGDLDTCPNVFDPGQTNDDGDGWGNACDPDADNDGVLDEVDNCPLAVNPGQEDTFGDDRGDMCEDVYFYDDFENGLDRWTIISGEWTTSVEAAVSGEFGLVDRVGLSIANLNTRIITPVIDLSRAFTPRLWFQGRFDLVDNGLLVEVVVGDEVLESIELVGPGNLGRTIRNYQLDLSHYVGRNDIQIRLKFVTSRNPGLGVWIDNFRVDEGPVFPGHVLPVYEAFNHLDRWNQFGGEWGTTIQAYAGPSAAHMDEIESSRRGESILELKRGLDLRGNENPELSFWLFHDVFDENNHILIELQPLQPQLETITFKPVAAGRNGYYEKFTVPMSALAGDPHVRVRIRFVHRANRRSWVMIDELAIEERPDIVPESLPKDLWIPNDLVMPETGGWGIVEEPVGTPSLRSSGFGIELNSEVRTTLGHYDFSTTANPMISIWARYALRADRQRFILRALFDDTVVDFPILEPTGQDIENGQFERLDISVQSLAGESDVELKLIVTTTDDGFLGVDISRLLIGDMANVQAQQAPVRWDFDETTPTMESISGRWRVSPGAGRLGSSALRLVSRLGLRGMTSRDHTRILPPLDLRPLDRPELSFWVRHFNNAINHTLRVRVRTPDRGDWTEMISRTTGQRTQDRSDGYQRIVISLDAVAGSAAATIELEATSDGEDPLDVGIDDIRVENRESFPMAQIFADGNERYTVFVNGDEIGTAERWFAGERFAARLQVGTNVIAFEVDGPADGPRLLGGLLLGDTLVRSGDSGWKSSTIQADGSVEQDWMAINFDSVTWANVSTDGPVPSVLNQAVHLGLESDMGAKFMSNSGGGTRQYFRKTFELLDTDNDLVPDAVDTCPQDPTGPERDANGNGLGDSCDFCPDCPNIAFGKPVTASSVRQNTPKFRGPSITNGAARCDRWKAEQNTGWVEIDLGARYSVCSARWINSTDCANYNAGVQAWRLTVRDEEGEEMEVGAGDEGNRLADQRPRVIDFQLCQPARYVRFYVDRSAGDRAALSELQVYGEPL